MTALSEVARIFCQEERTYVMVSYQQMDGV